MRWSERPPVVRSRFKWLMHLHSERRALSVVVAHLILVRPMRTLSLIAVLLFCGSAPIASAETPAGPQLSAYQKQVSDIAFRAIIPQFKKHPEHLRGALKVTFRLDRRGRPSEITVASSTQIDGFRRLPRE